MGEEIDNLELTTLTNEVEDLVKKLESELFKLKSIMKKDFQTLHKQLDRFEDQMLKGFRELEYVIQEKRPLSKRSYRIIRK